MKNIEILIAQAVEQKQSAVTPSTAFEELVRLFQDAVYGYAVGVVKDSHLARDVVQDTLLSAYEKLEDLRRPDAFWPWIRTIARRECIRAVRNAGSREFPDGNEDIIVSHHDSPEALFEKRQSRERVQSAIESLSENNRVPCVLFYLSGYSQQEIAEILELNLNTVKKRIQRGREQLKLEMIDMIRETLGKDMPSYDSQLFSRISLAASFQNAARLGQLGLIEAMLVDGIDVNEADIKGRTLLHCAAQNGHLEAVEMLLKCGADTTLIDRTGQSADELAREAGFSSIAAMIRGWNER